MADSETQCDVIVIGGGHNGLTAAAYLAGAGRKVTVLERRSILGGAAVTEEFHPGYRNSMCSYVASLLNPTVVRELELERHGLQFLPVTSSFSPKPDGRYLLQTGDVTHDQANVAQFSNTDWQGMARLDAIIDEIADLVRPLMLKPPPQIIDGALGIADILSMGGSALAFRRMSSDVRHRTVQFFTASVRQIVERYIESEAVRTQYYSSSTAGAMASLDQPGSAINLLHLSLGETAGVRGRWSFVRGGMGAISEAIAAAARERGVEIRTSAGVRNIIIEQGRAVGVCLESGEDIRARCVVSGCEPKLTFLRLIESEHLDADFRADMAGWRTESGSFRMNLALRELPDFTCLPGTSQAAHHAGFISLKPTSEAIERAFMAAKGGEIPDEPLVTMVIPSTLDDTLAPPGHHVMSVFAQHFPYQLSGSRSWDDAKPEAAERVIETMCRYAPNLRDAIVGQMALSPLDLEREYGLSGGDVYHGKMELDQIFAMRPHPKCAGHRTPIAGLYLCGAGTHPGGGVSGAPGHNAAKVVMGDL